MIEGGKKADCLWTLGLKSFLDFLIDSHYSRQSAAKAPTDTQKKKNSKETLFSLAIQLKTFLAEPTLL